MGKMRSKIIIRKLPADFSPDILMHKETGLLKDWLVHFSDFYFVPGKLDPVTGRERSSSRLYLTFVDPTKILSFISDFGRLNLFENTPNAQKPILEFAPFQEMPSSNENCGLPCKGIDSNELYVKYLQQKQNPSTAEEKIETEQPSTIIKIAKRPSEKAENSVENGEKEPDSAKQISEPIKTLNTSKKAQSEIRLSETKLLREENSLNFDKKTRSKATTRKQAPVKDENESLSKSKLSSNNENPDSQIHNKKTRKPKKSVVKEEFQSDAIKTKKKQPINDFVKKTASLQNPSLSARAIGSSLSIETKEFVPKFIQQNNETELKYLSKPDNEISNSIEEISKEPCIQSFKLNSNVKDFVPKTQK